jgi:hypothetical protein
MLIARAFPIEAFVLSRCAEAMAIECSVSLAERWVEGSGRAWGWAEGGDRVGIRPWLPGFC